MSIDWKAEYEAEHERRLADKASIAALAAENDFVRAESDLIDEKVERIRSLEAALLRHGHKDGSCGLCTALETACDHTFEAMASSPGRVCTKCGHAILGRG